MNGRLRFGRDAIFKKGEGMQRMLNKLNKREKEPNFIDKRRQWKSQLDSPLTRRSLIMVLPAVVLCVFLMLAAPYLKILVEEMVQDGDELIISRPLNLEDEPEKAEDIGPPPNPEQVLLQQYRERLEAEGFDWRATPQVEAPDLGLAREQPIAIEPVAVELPSTMAELEARRQAGN